jgi:hypothetical protein
MIKGTAKFLVVIMFLFSLSPKIEAEFVPSELMNVPPADREADLAKIQNALESKMFKNRLKQLGFTEEEINARLEKLSDQELHQLALQIEDLKKGGNGLGLIIALLVIAVLVILIMKLMGKKIEVIDE